MSSLTIASLLVLLVATPLSGEVEVRSRVRDVNPPASRQTGRIDNDGVRLHVLNPDAIITDRIEADPLVVDIGRVELGATADVHGAITLHIYSNRPWALMVGSTRASALMPVSRLQYRTSRSGGFIPVAEPREAARGNATSEGGEVITIDLRLAPDTEDPSGQFDADLEFMLRPI